MSAACIPRSLAFEVTLLIALGPLACDPHVGDKPSDPAADVAPAAAPKGPVKVTSPTLEALYTGTVAARLVDSGVAQWDTEAAAPLPPGGAAPEVAEPPPSPSGPPSIPVESLPIAKRSARVRSPAPMSAAAESDPVWVLPATPEVLLWRHPPDDDGLALDLLDSHGQPWPSRVRLQRDDVAYTARVELLAELDKGAEYRIVARSGAATSSRAWSVTLQLPAP